MSNRYKNAIIVLTGCHPHTRCSDDNRYFVTARSDDRDAEAIRKASKYAHENGYVNMSTVKELDRLIAEDKVGVEVIKLPGEFTKKVAINKKHAIMETLKAMRYSVLNDTKELYRLLHRQYDLSFGR